MVVWYPLSFVLTPISPLSCRYVYWKGKGKGVIIHTVAAPGLLCLCFRTLKQWILMLWLFNTISCFGMCFKELMFQLNDVAFH